MAQPKRNKKNRNLKKPEGLKGFFQSQWLSKNPILVFVGLFILMFSAFYLFWVTDFFKQNILSGIIAANAWVGSGILYVLGQGTASHGSVITSSLFSVDIKEGCDAIEPIALLICAVLAFPIAMNKKWQGILLGGAFLIAMNVLRIVTLFLVGSYDSTPDKYWFDLMHVEVWQVIFILMAIVSWLVWIKWAIGKTDQAPPAAKPKLSPENA